MKSEINQVEMNTQNGGKMPMKNKLTSILKNEKGLTLIELLAVIVILAIVSAIAIPSIGNIVENSRYNAVKADAINVINAANLYYTENPQGDDKATDGSTVTSIKVSQLETEGYLESAGKIPEGATITSSSPRKLDAVVTYSGTKTVTFDDATIELINANDDKGSATDNKTIGPGTP